MCATAITALTASTLLAVPASAAPSTTVHPATGAKTKVIVLLRNQHQNVPATTKHLGARRTAIKADQSPLRSEIGKLGGSTTRAYSAVNAVAATVPSGGLATLRANPAVSAVVPDLPRHMLAPSAATGSTGTKRAAVPSSGAQYCPTDPSKPQLEPEALQNTHTASDDPSALTARSAGYDGTGVKVGFIADGTDIDQPDLIRADGSHVVTDYQDFSGDGTNSTSSGGEAMLDVGSIAAQGRTSYDISQFVNPAHPLPAGCNIRVEGMAPGVSVVALKVFPNALLTAPTSALMQAVDYAVNVDHVNVLNESFGANPYPDTAQDPVSIANQDAVDAGVTVTASTGDNGAGNTLGTGSTDPNVIAVGASTSERVYAQTGTYGFPLSNGKYTSNQVSGLSSSGISQTNRVMDLLAPGDLNWTLCSDRQLDGQPQYTACTDYNGHPSNLAVEGGTSESSPLTAGAAALVIQAYRTGHGGASPTPAQVRNLLDSSADDLGLPADEQGAGLLNTYRATALAKNYGVAGAPGTEMATNQVQFDNVRTPGYHPTNTVRLTNHGAGVERVTASVRSVSHVSSQQTQSVAFDPTTAPTFLDVLGRARPYVEKTFTVPAGTDRMDLLASVAGDGTKYVRASLLDPSGAFAAYTLPQGTGNVGHIDFHQPAPGTWTAILWSSSPTTDASISGPISLRTRYFTATSAGTVTPSTATIPAGGSQTFKVTTTTPSAEASAASLVFAHRGGEHTTVSIVNRAEQSVSVGHQANFSGTFDLSNGRDFGPGETFTYLVNVPSGARDLEANVAISGKPYNQIEAHLTDPTGEPVAFGTNFVAGSGGATTSYSGLQLAHAKPRAGLWQMTLEFYNQSSGAALPQSFRGSFVLNGVKATGGTPSGVTLSKRGGSTRYLHITNTSPTPQTYFVDGRSTAHATYNLVASDVKGDAPSTTDPYSRTVQVPLVSDDVIPAWLVPTQISTLTVGSSSGDPIAFDLSPLDNPSTLNAPNNPDIEAVSSGRSATATHTNAEVGSAQWIATPSPLGTVPANGSTPTSATFHATATGRAFDGDVSSSTGDVLLGTVNAAAAAAHPITLQPGQSATVTVHFAPTGAVGSFHTGTLFVDIAQAGALGTTTLTEEIASLPYSYTVGR